MEEKERSWHDLIKILSNAGIEEGWFTPMDFILYHNNYNKKEDVEYLGKYVKAFVKRLEDDLKTLEE